MSMSSGEMVRGLAEVLERESKHYLYTRQQTREAIEGVLTEAGLGELIEATKEALEYVDLQTKYEPGLNRVRAALAKLERGLKG